MWSEGGGRYSSHPDFSEGHRETCRPRKHVRIYFLGAFFLENRLILLSVSISKNKENPSKFPNHWSKVKLMHLCPNAYNEPGTVMARRIRREMSQTGCFLWQLLSKNSQFTGVGVGQGCGVGGGGSRLTGNRLITTPCVKHFQDMVRVSGSPHRELESKIQGFGVGKGILRYLESLRMSKILIVIGRMR